MNYFDQQSKRLLLRKLSPADIPAWTSFFINNDRLKYLGIDLSKSPKTHAQEWIERQLNRYESIGLGHLAAVLKDTGELIGVGGIIQRELEGKTEFEIAYSIIPTFWNKGYATEIAQQLKAYGFAHMEAERFISIIDKQNADSIKVARKNNMQCLFETQYLNMHVYVYAIRRELYKVKTLR